MTIRIMLLHEGNNYIGVDITQKLYQNDTIGFGVCCPGLIKDGGKDEYWLYYYGQPLLHNDLDLHFSGFYYRIKVILN
jgi:hypothetical protein